MHCCQLQSPWWGFYALLLQLALWWGFLVLVMLGVADPLKKVGGTGTGCVLAVVDTKVGVSGTWVTGSLGALSVAGVRVADAVIVFADPTTVVRVVMAGVTGTVVKSAGIGLRVAGNVMQVFGILVGLPGTVLKTDGTLAGVAGTVMGLADTCTVAEVAGTVVRAIGAVLAGICTEGLGTATCT